MQIPALFTTGGDANTVNRHAVETTEPVIHHPVQHQLIPVLIWQESNTMSATSTTILQAQIVLTATNPTMANLEE